MSNIPNPFRNQSHFNVNPPSTPHRASSPGFLAMTRPASASTIGHDGRGRSMGRANYRSHYHPRSAGPYSNNSNNYHSYGQQNRNFSGRNQFSNSGQQSSPTTTYENRDQNQSYHTPGKNYYQKHNNRFSNAPYYQSTPQTFHQNRNDRGGFNKRSFNNSSRGSFHKTPLKEIPVDKFISINMIKDPWEDLDSDTDFDPFIDSSHSKSDPFCDKIFLDSSHDDNSMEEIESINSSSTSTQKETDHNIEVKSDSITGPFTSSSEKDTGTESDAISDS